ncbi:MAG: RteC domain-containing protein [Flavobacteriaceae bacterium]|nr:RteC domain-containing protein [Flavobacteriaceae bacterium]
MQLEILILWSTMKLKLLADNLLEELSRIERSAPSIIERSRRSIQSCRVLLSKFRKEIIQKGFQSESDEIQFFKEIKQVPLVELIYHKKIYQLEICFPSSTSNRQKKFIKEQLETYNQFFLRNIDFGQYTQLSHTHFDNNYFTRKPIDELPILGFSNYVEDPEFSTPKDLTLAKFKAYGKLTLYLNEKLHSFTHNGNAVNGKAQHLRWTGTKIDLIELVYALQASGAIQGGESGVKEVASACESLFNVDLGNYYRKFIELRSRKLVERTRFIDRLKSSLIERMKEADD